jgi:NADPH2:quinone reductase
MTAIVAPRPGGVEALVAETRPLPTIGADEILVGVHAAGVNRPDVLQRQGNYAPPPGVTDVLGLEIAGEVVAAGAGATRFRPGDRVLALVPGGGYAEYAAVHRENALPLPAGLSMIEAAAIPETFFTVWTSLFDRGRLAAGETALIHGGGSGIGTTAIQLARAFGARVIVTAGSAEKCAACVKLGADVAVDYSRADDDFVARVAEATGGRGADVILDMVGGDYVPRNYAAAAVEGRIVQIAMLRGWHPETDLRLLMGKRLVHTGSTLRPRPVAFKAAIAAALEEKVWPLIAAGRVRPVIDSVFPLAEVGKAHARIEAADHFGKVVLAVRR